MNKEPVFVIEKKPDKTVIEFLEDVLADAKRGEVIAVAIVCGHSDGCVSSSWAGIKSCATRIVGKLFTTAVDLSNQINNS